MLNLFLAHGAITQAKHDKSLHDLTEKMGGKEHEVRDGAAHSEVFV